MGWETALFFGFNALKAQQAIKEGKANARATVAEGNLVSKNKAKEIAQKAAGQTVSFLNSGLTLEGTPQTVIQSTYNTGIEDLGQIRKNYNTRASNIVSAARTQALSTLASTAAMAFMPEGGFGEMFGSGGNLNAIDAVGNGTSGWGSSVVGYNGGLDMFGSGTEITLMEAKL